MSYVTSPFEVLLIIAILCALAAFGITVLFNKFIYDLPFKWDVAMGASIFVALLVTSARAIF